MFRAVAELHRAYFPQVVDQEEESEEILLKDIIKKLCEELHFGSNKKIGVSIPQRWTNSVTVFSSNLPKSPTIEIPSIWLENLASWLPKGFERRRPGEKFSAYLLRATSAIHKNRPELTKQQIELVLRSFKKPRKATQLVKYQLAYEICNIRCRINPDADPGVSAFFTILMAVLLRQIGFLPTQWAVAISLASFVAINALQAKNSDPKTLVFRAYPDLRAVEKSSKKLIEAGKGKGNHETKNIESESEEELSECEEPEEESSEIEDPEEIEGSGSKTVIADEENQLKRQGA